MKKKVDSKTYYNSISSSYEELYGQEQIEKVKVIESLLKEKQILDNKGKIIDLGCGSGLSSNWLSKYGYNIYGYDVSEKLIELAKSNYPNNNYFCYDVDNIKSKNFKQSDFEIGISVSAIQNFKRPYIVFKELIRISKNVIITYPKKIDDESLIFLKENKNFTFFDCKKDKGYIYTP